MSWHRGLDHIIQRDVSLAPHTTFRIGGKAEYLATPRDGREFGAVYAAARKSGLPVHILGLGSNLLVADEGVPGVVVATRRMCRMYETRRDGVVRVEAGVPLQRLIGWAVSRGLAGVEMLVCIPGSVGGAVVMNAGTPEATIGEAVVGVWCVDGAGRLFRRDAADVSWGYRTTDINEPVVEVEVALRPEDPDEIQSRMTAALRRRQVTQPLDLPSAGCFFRNPPGDAAGRLLDLAGMKGARLGGAEVSAKHANFIVNRGGARASDVVALARMASERVFTAFGVRLEEEVRFWPCLAASAAAG